MSKLHLLVGYASRDRDYKESLKEYIADFKSRKLIADSEEVELTHHSIDDIKPRIQAAHVIVLIIGEHFLASDRCEKIRQLALRMKGNKRDNVAHIMINPHVYERENVTILPHETYPISYTDHWGSTINAWETTAKGLEKILHRESAPSWWEKATAALSKGFKPVVAIAIAALLIGLLLKAIFWFMGRDDQARIECEKDLWAEKVVKEAIHFEKFQGDESLRGVYVDALTDYFLKYKIDCSRWKVYNQSAEKPDWAFVNFGLKKAFGKSFACILRNESAQKAILLVMHFDNKGKPLLEAADIGGQPSCDDCISVEVLPAGIPLNCAKNQVSNFESLLLKRSKTANQVLWVDNTGAIGWCDQAKK